MRLWPFAKQPRPDVRPGAISLPDPSITNTIGNLTSFYAFANPTFPFEFLELLPALGMFNPDVAQMLSMWVNLGNTGHEVAVDARNAEAVLQRLNFLAANIYRVGGGVDALINHFFRQIGLMGALSGEWVIAPNIAEGASDVVVVPVKTIRFKYNAGAWEPWQVAPVITGTNAGYVQLNPLTYSYSPLMTDDGCPYAIPIVFAALKNIEIQIDGVGNISSIIRKMGLLGFLDVVLKAPERNVQESDEAYRQRLQNRLKDYAKSYRQNLSRGVAVHYNDQEIKHNAVAPGAAGGAKAIFDLNEEQIFSGIDTPPSMAGRSYSTTETYAEVDYQRTTRKFGNGRRLIKRFLEKGYSLDLLLRGIDARVSVTFNSDPGYKAKEEAEAEGQKIKNVLEKRNAGIIDQDQAARELGYEKATGILPGSNPPDGFFGEAKRFVFNRQMNRYEFAPERIVLETPADDRRDQSFQAALESVLDGPEQSAIEAGIAAGKYGQGFKSAEGFAREVYSAFARTLRAEVATSAVMKVCARFVTDEWNRWRYEDKNHLRCPRPLSLSPGVGGAISFDDRKIDISVVDKNAIRYITKIEDFYYGRGNYLARNETVGKEFISWLQDEYITHGLNIRDDATWNEFKTRFAGLVQETSFQKIEQLVSTTMGRIQNMGQTLSLYEAGIKRYQIVGPRTPPICQHCRAMLGRIFDVQVAASRLAKVLDKGFEKPDDLPPFLSNTYTADQVKEMTDAELEAAGFETPPYHTKCRHRKAAVD